MRYIKTYNEIEESKLSKFLWGAGIIATIGLNLYKYFSKTDTEYLMEQMKKQESLPTLVIKNRIDSLKKTLIDEINLNPMYKDRDIMIDSIKSIPIYFVNLNRISDKPSGVNIIFDNKDIKRCVIFIEKNNKDGNDNLTISRNILHELYHFIVHFQKIDFTNIIDKKTLTDDKRLLEKVCLIYGKFHTYDELKSSKEIEKSMIKMQKLIKKEKDYLTSNDELSTRILNMRNFLKTKGLIKNTFDDLKESDLIYLVNNWTKDKTNEYDHFMRILPFIQFDKLFTIKDLENK